MNEREWLASADPGAMLSEVTKGISPAHDFRISDRKLRLWVEACRAYSGASDYVDDLCTRYGLRVALEYWGSRDGASVPQAVRAHLLRDIVGTPHRPVAFRMPPDCDYRSDLWGLASGLAQAAYEERDPATGHLDPVRLAVLADALEEAGCDSEPLLAHLRDRPCPCSFRHLPHDSCDGSAFMPKIHVRGCWAIDLLAGRE